MEQNRRIISNNKGQFAIEAVLLMALFVGVFVLVVNQLRDRKIIQNLTDASVVKVRNLSEYGTWRQECKAVKGSARQTAANCHPNSINRALSSDPQ